MSIHRHPVKLDDPAAVDPGALPEDTLLVVQAGQLVDSGWTVADLEALVGVDVGPPTILDGGGGPTVDLTAGGWYVIPSNNVNLIRLPDSATVPLGTKVRLSYLSGTIPSPLPPSGSPAVQVVPALGSSDAIAPGTSVHLAIAGAIQVTVEWALASKATIVGSPFTGPLWVPTFDSDHHDHDFI